jgi:MFS family permease
MGLIAFLAMLGTPLAPALLAGPSLFAMLLSLQFLLGIAQAPTFPVYAGVFETWFPPNQWALVAGLQTMGLPLGAAVTPAPERARPCARRRWRRRHPRAMTW